MSHVSSPAVTAYLVHRRQAAPAEWWQGAVLCDVDGAWGDRGLEEVGDCVLTLARTGFTAFVVRPAHSDLVSRTVSLARLLARGHRAGLRGVIRMSGAGADGGRAFFDLESDPATVVLRTRAALKAGADGVDLGRIQDEADGAGANARPDPRDARERARTFSRLIRVELAELADWDERRPILAAAATLSDPTAYSRHLLEEWFHHLRDDALSTAPWDAEAIAGRVREAYGRHDPVGQICAWRASDPREPGAAAPARPGSWQAGADTRRHLAMTAFLLSLPGAVYLPFSASGGVGVLDAAGRPHLAVGTAPGDVAQRRLASQAIRTRTEHAMGRGSLARVLGLPWQFPGVTVHISGGVMVVLNTSQESAAVPPSNRLLLRSDAPAADQLDGEPTALPPSTCAWFAPARVLPPPARFHD